MSNPFRKGTTSYEDFELMSDLKWHCTKCELKSGQAKTWQTWKDEKGIKLGQDEKGNFYKSQHCNSCGRKTFHRKIDSIEVSKGLKPRSGVSKKVSQRVKKIYNNEEAIFLRKMSSNILEVDHKFPQIRWNSPESNNDNLSDTQLKEKFILLTRANNLWKSRQCEKCFNTGKRGTFPGLYFWYRGDEFWDNKINIHSEEGCIGCFWYDPYSWRKELNKIIKNS